MGKFLVVAWALFAFSPVASMQQPLQSGPTGVFNQLPLDLKLYIIVTKSDSYPEAIEALRLYLTSGAKNDKDWAYNTPITQRIISALQDRFPQENPLQTALEKLLYITADIGTPSAAHLFKQAIEQSSNSFIEVDPIFVYECSKTDHVQACRRAYCFLEHFDLSQRSKNLALVNATAVHNSRLSKMLLAYQADPNTVGHSGATPLSNAIMHTNAQLVERLLAHGASPALEIGNGLSPLRLALEKAHQDIIELIKTALAQQPQALTRLSKRLLD